MLAPLAFVICTVALVSSCFLAVQDFREKKMNSLLLRCIFIGFNLWGMLYSGLVIARTVLGG